MNKKILLNALVLLLCISFFTGCKKQTNFNTDETLSYSTSDGITMDNNTEVTPPTIKIGVAGETLSFPFKYDDLEKLVELSDSDCVYFKDQDFSVCNVYSGYTRICTLFVQGDVSQHTSETLVTSIIIDNPEKGIFTLNGLKDDTDDAYIKTFGLANKKTNKFLEYEWDNIFLSVSFDEETGKAYDIMLLDTDYPYSL